jgi:hypothetical protein
MSNASGAPVWINANASGIGTTYTAGNGLSLVSNTFKLGGLLSQNTDIGFSGFSLTFSDGGTTFASFSSSGKKLSTILLPSCLLVMFLWLMI